MLGARVAPEHDRGAPGDIFRQEHVHKLLYESLTHFGVLGLGSRESLAFSGHREAYEELDESVRLYRKVG